MKGERVLRFLVYIFSMGAAFAAGYRLTDIWFRAHLIPYPFEGYGVAVGLAFLFWALALLQIAELLIRRCGMKRISLISAVLFCILALGACGVFADEAEQSQANSRLQQVVDTQQQILKQLEDIKSELQVLKVRVSQNQ